VTQSEADLLNENATHMRLIIDDMEKNIAKVATCVVGALSSNISFVQKLNKLRN
jgi:hypothetical protein